MQMFRLASNRKFNREIKSVMEELEASGLNVFSEVSGTLSFNMHSCVLFAQLFLGWSGGDAEHGQDIQNRSI